jgi:hypothetical protein
MVFSSSEVCVLVSASESPAGPRAGTRGRLTEAHGRPLSCRPIANHRLNISRNTVSRGLVPTTYEAFFSAGVASFFPFAGSPIVVSFT